MLNLSVPPAIRSGQRSGLSTSDVSLAGPVDVGIRRGLGSFSIDGRVWDMRMPCQRAMLNNTTIYPPFEREASCCLSANAISHKIVRLPLNAVPSFSHSLQNHVKKPPTSRVTLSIFATPERDADVGLEARSERHYHSVCYHLQSARR